MLTPSKVETHGIKQPPKTPRPAAPPAQSKKDLEKLYVDAIKLIDKLQEENEQLRRDKQFLSKLINIT